MSHEYSDSDYYWEKAEFQDPIEHRRHVDNYKKGIPDSYAFDEQYRKEALEELRKETNMDGYWRIWFEVFENDKKIGAGVWCQVYKHKSSAVRRAKQMWDKDVYSPITNTTIRREWIVSQTNPWGENTYNHDRVMERLKQTLGE